MIEKEIEVEIVALPTVMRFWRATKQNPLNLRSYRFPFSQDRSFHVAFA